MTDHQRNIIRAAQKGDESSFRILVEEHYMYAYRVAFRLLLDGDDARDAVQDAFIKVWQNIGVFRLNMNFTTWLYRIVTNASLDLHRRRSRLHEAHRHAASDDIERRTPQQFAEDRDVREMILALLRRLPTTQRLVFALRDMEDLSINDVASITGFTTASVKTNLSYARRTIQTLLTTEYQIERSDP